MVGRQVNDFATIRSHLLSFSGDNDDGQNVGVVLRQICPRYHLQYVECDELGARAAIHARRPVVATFALDQTRWTRFSEFYRLNPTGTLSANNMGSVATAGEKIDGHAVVLVRCDAASLTFMNSWGPKFANAGFFTIDKPATLQVAGGPSVRFYDVYWTTADLTRGEVQAWTQHGNQTVQGVINTLPKSFHDLPVSCPHCKRSVAAREYDGTWHTAKCRGCRRTFQPTVAALVKTLYESSSA